MSSISSGFKQRLTRTFVQTQDNNSGEAGPIFFKQSDIDSWIQSNSSDIKATGGAYIITGDFSTVINSLSNSDGLQRITERKTIIDMGKEYIIGNIFEPRLVVLRKVKVYGPTSVGGDSTNAVYVAVENNLESDTALRFQVKVARV
jgi:hypothetical protein